MNRQYDSDELWDDDYPDDEDDDSSCVIACPSCGGEVYDDAEQCPHCGDYITADTNPWSGRSLWWIALALAGIAATVIVLALR